MPLSRTQPMPDLFGAVADHEPHHGPARLTSIRPTSAVMSTADKSSPRYVLPKDLSNALQQLDDLELDRLVAASRHELQRRGRPMTSAPEIRPTTHISPGELTSKPSIAKDSLSERQQLPEPKGTLKQGQVNAVLAAFAAGIAPSRIARQFGLSGHARKRRETRYVEPVSIDLFHPAGGRRRRDHRCGDARRNGAKLQRDAQDQYRRLGRAAQRGAHFAPRSQGAGVLRQALHRAQYHPVRRRRIGDRERGG